MPEKHHIIKSPLLPCPFCGSAPALIHEYIGDNLIRMGVQCTGEGCWATIKDYQENGTPLENLTTAWNKRAPQ